MRFNLAPQKKPKGIISLDLSGRLTALENEIKFAPNSLLNKSIVKEKVSLVFFFYSAKDTEILMAKDLYLSVPLNIKKLKVLAN